MSLFYPSLGKVLTCPELEKSFRLALSAALSYRSILVANKICNDLGMDTISAGHVISWAMETYERGIITQEQTDGLALNFGNIEAQHTLLRRIASGTDFCRLLANGTRHASQETGKILWEVGNPGERDGTIRRRCTDG
jgi:aldehyde:ferredoxin oxidoreductase